MLLSSLFTFLTNLNSEKWIIKVFWLDILICTDLISVVVLYVIFLGWHAFITGL